MTKQEFNELQAFTQQITKIDDKLVDLNDNLITTDPHFKHDDEIIYRLRKILEDANDLIGIELRFTLKRYKENGYFED